MAKYRSVYGDYSSYQARINPPKERARTIAWMVANTRLPYEEIGRRFGVSRQRVGQIARRFRCARRRDDDKR